MTVAAEPPILTTTTTGWPGYTVPDRRRGPISERGIGGQLDLPRAHEGGFGGGFFAVAVTPDPAMPRLPNDGFTPTADGPTMPLSPPRDLADARHAALAMTARLFRRDAASAGRNAAVRFLAAKRVAEPAPETAKWTGRSAPRYPGLVDRMHHHAAARVRGFGTSVFTEMSRLATQHGAVNLGQGFPDFPGPGFVKEAAKAAIDADLNQYAVAYGAPRLRTAIAADWARERGRTLDPESEITVTSGATETIFDAIQAFLGPDDEIVAFEPFYDSYPASATLAGGRLVPVTLRPPDWRFDPDELAAAFSPRTRLLLLNTPHNPTGKVFSRAELDIVAGLCREHDVVALADEVYDRIVFDGAIHVPLAEMPGMWERTLSINSTGKTFSMTGWKIGYAVGPAGLNAALRAVHQFVTFASATPFQDAMAAAMEAAPGLGYYHRLRTEYAARRDLMRAALEGAGLPTLPIAGSYFLMADVVGLGFPDDVAFCRWLTAEVGVAAVPPSAFYLDPARAPLLARFCFAKREETLREAAARLARLPEKLAAGREFPHPLTPSPVA